MTTKVSNAILFRLTALIVMVSVELITILGWICSFLPHQSPALMNDLFERHRPLVVPEYDMLLFRLAVVLVLIAVIFVGGSLVKKIDLNTHVNLLNRIIIIETISMLVVLWAYLQWIFYHQDGWPNVVMGIVAGLSLISKIFFPELIKFAQFIKSQYFKLTQIKHKSLIATVLMGLLILNIIWVRDVQAVLGAMFLTDHFHHLDTMIMSPAWAALKGMVLNIDTFTHYAVGLPITLGNLMKIFGGFGYEQMLTLMMLASIIYYILFFMFTRALLNNVWIAGAATVLLMKWQLFHGGVAPFIFNYPSATVLRYPLDILLLWTILRQWQRPSWSNLATGSIICAFSLFYMIDSGVYMLLTWIAFLGAQLFIKNQQKTLKLSNVLMACGSIALSIVGTIILLCLTQGQWIFTSLFWQNFAERTALFLAGHGNILMTQSFLNGKIVEGAVGFIILAFYLVVLALSVLLILLNQQRRFALMSLVITVYGLASYHYYVCRSADTSYNVVVMPFVLLLAIGLLFIVEKFNQYARQILIGSFSLVTFCLFTNHQFLAYPHWWSLTASPVVRPMVPIKLEGQISFMNHHQVMWNPSLKLEKNSLDETDEQIRTEQNFKDDQELKEYFLREFNFDKDSDLIRQYTTSETRVPLISSFETRILMQADRKPFFYYFPLVDSRPMQMRMFDMTALWTKTRLKRTMDQLTEQKPAYIFMEKILLTNSVPQAYTYLYPDLLVILGYINQAYEPVGYGKFLVALKRK